MKRTLSAVLGLAMVVAAGCERPGEPMSTVRPTTGPAAAMANPTTLPAGKLNLTDAQWKARLTPEQYYILREKGTERPGTGTYDNFFQAGTYECAACGQVLFRSGQKYDSGCGWPAFSTAAATGAVLELPDADGSRTEVECSRCGGHLGHVFDDGPPPSGKRYCIDSAALKFVPDKPTTQPGK